jgi:hypothetical protein
MMKLSQAIGKYEAGSRKDSNMFKVLIIILNGLGI